MTKEENRWNAFQDTRKKFKEANQNEYHRQARENQQHWASESTVKPSKIACVTVEKGDWGAITLKKTIQYGQIFAVLNMANGERPWAGDGRSGTQEEDMACRTDLYEAIALERNLADPTSIPYDQNTKDLIHGVHGKAYLDTVTPRVCIKDTAKKDGTYDDLPKEKQFLFYELRSAADIVGKRTKLKGDNKDSFDETSMRRKISAQLDTLIEKKIRHVILGAFGCGAFDNPPDEVARIYSEELAKRREQFSVVVFAIYENDGRSNFKPFEKRFKNFQSDFENKNTVVEDPSTLVTEPPTATTEPPKAITEPVAAASTTRPSVIAPASSTATVSSTLSKTSSTSSSNKFKIMSGIATILGGLALILAFGFLNVATAGTALGITLAIVGGLSFFSGGLGLAVTCRKPGLVEHTNNQVSLSA